MTTNAPETPVSAPQSREARWYAAVHSDASMARCRAAMAPVTTMMPQDLDPDHVCQSLPCMVCGRMP